MTKETKRIDESLLIIKNLSELENTLKNLSMENDYEKIRKLIFIASLLIEKIIFYFQLNKGVEYIGVYNYPISNKETLIDVKDLYKFYKKLGLKNGLSLSKLIKLRYTIANIYIKYSSENRNKTKK